MFTYLALGDSYTIGEGVLSTDNFPNQLVQLLQQHAGLSVANPKIIATTGWTTDELQQGIKNQEPIGKYDFTTLLIGVNNQYRGYSMDQYRKEFSQLLYQAILYTRNGAENVFIVSIPDWGVTPFAHDRDREKIKQEIAQYNLIKKSIALMNKCNFIDITPSTILHGEDPSYLVSDLLHYSGKEYNDWAKLLVPQVSKNLGKLLK